MHAGGVDGENAVALRLEFGDRKIQKCPDCRGTRVMLWTAVFRDERQVALDYAFLYDHDGDRDVFQDVILGQWDWDHPDWSDHVTLSTHSRLDDRGEVGSMLIDGGSGAADDPIYGRKLSREAGLNDSRLPLVWEIIDLVLDQVHEVHAHLAGAPMPRRRWFRR